MWSSTSVVDRNVPRLGSDTGRRDDLRTSHPTCNETIFSERKVSNNMLLRQYGENLIHSSNNIIDV